MRLVEMTVVGAFILVIGGVPITQAINDTIDYGSPHFLKVFSDFPSSLKKGKSFKEHLHSWDKKSIDQSVFSKHIRPATQDFRYSSMRDLGSKAIAGVDDWLFYTPGVEYLVHPDYKNERFYKGSRDTLLKGKKVNLKNPVYAILDFQDQLNQRGIELLMVPVPSKPSIYPEKLDPNVDWEKMNSPTLKLIDHLREQGIKVVDLFHPLKEFKKTSDKELYLRQDTHWTPAGLKHAAQVIADRVKGYPWYPGALEKFSPAKMNEHDSSEVMDTKVKRFSLKTVDVTRWGDVAEMTKIPSRKAIWDSQTVVAEKVIDNMTGEPYKDNVDSPILWLGDSFSRIYQTDDPHSAGVIAHLAYALEMPLTSLVNDGGASTIVRQQLYRQDELLKNKKLVIWEFVERDVKFGAKGWSLEELPPSS